MGDPVWPHSAENVQLVCAIVGRNITRERERARLSVRALSSATQLDRRTLERLEAGVSDPRLTTLVRLSFGLWVPVGAVVDGMPEPEGRASAPERLDSK